MTGFYMITASVMKELTETQLIYLEKQFKKISLIIVKTCIDQF